MAAKAAAFIMWRLVRSDSVAMITASACANASASRSRGTTASMSPPAMPARETPHHPHVEGLGLAGDLAADAAQADDDQGFALQGADGEVHLAPGPVMPRLGVAKFPDAARKREQQHHGVFGADRGLGPRRIGQRHALGNAHGGDALDPGGVGMDPFQCVPGAPAKRRADLGRANAVGEDHQGGITHRRLQVARRPHDGPIDIGKSRLNSRMRSSRRLV